MTNFIDIGLGVAQANHFNEVYYPLHVKLLEDGIRQESRNGPTVEKLAFKTTVFNPVRRCVGGRYRNINIFFLLAEALWIWAGRKDVAFLDTYNSQLKQYSDDGNVYHAPYGFRLRRHGVVSENELDFGTGIDQLYESVLELHNDPDSRRVVLQIWNANLDLCKKSKDLPCNDLVMWKIRQGRLYTTISNRSNDLNLGLTTNFFQFSFISEIVARLLGIDLGSETHNSDSLHIYTDFEITQQMIYQTTVNKVETPLLYEMCDALPITFNWDGVDNTMPERFKQVDSYIKCMITALHARAKGTPDANHEELMTKVVAQFSPELYMIYRILSIYVMYKDKTLTRREAFQKLTFLFGTYGPVDYIVLAMNFFAARMLASVKDDDAKFISEYRAKFHKNSALAYIGMF